MRTKALPPLILAAVLGLAGCSSEPMASPAPESSNQESESPSPSVDPDLPTDEDLQDFVTAIASGSASELETAQELVVEGSPAADYLTYYLHITNAQLDSGFSASDTSPVESVEGGFELCDPAPGESVCSSYTDFQGKEGKISDFQIQGHDLSERLVSGTGEIVEGPNGSEVEFVSAYRNASDTHLIYTYTVRSGSTAMYMPQLSYRNPDGRQTNPELEEGAWDLAPNSYSSYAAWLPAGELGGKAMVELLPEHGEPLSLELPTPEQQ